MDDNLGFPFNHELGIIFFIGKFYPKGPCIDLTTLLMSMPIETTYILMIDPILYGNTPLNPVRLRFPFIES